MKNITVAPAGPSDLEETTRLMVQLWPEYNPEELEGFVKNDATAGLLLAKKDTVIIGFVMLSIRRDYVEGSDSSPVGYVEGIFMLPEFRQLSVGQVLMHEAELWCLSKGCQEIGSDTESENMSSILFHEKCGYQIAGHNIHFIKKLKI